MNPIIKQEPYASFLAPKTTETKITYAQNLSFIRKFLEKEVYQATPNELKAFFLDCIRRGIKKTTMQTYKATLGSFFNHLIIDEESPFHRIDDPTRLLRAEIDTKNKDKTVRKALTLEQREAVYNCLDWQGDIHEYQMNLAILFGFKVGLRRHEIAKVQWKDINFEDRTLFVIGKGAKPATVPLSKIVIDRLQDYKMLVDKAGIDTRWIFFRSSYNFGNSFTKADPSKHFLKWAIADWYKVIKKRAGLGNDVLFATHDGRRIFCSTLHEHKVDDLTAIRLSRHDSVDMFKKYVRIDEDKIKKALNDAVE